MSRDFDQWYHEHDQCVKIRRTLEGRNEKLLAENKRLQAEIDRLTAENKRLQTEITARIQREEAICPKDVAWDEHIKQQAGRIAKMKKALLRMGEFTTQRLSLDELIRMMQKAIEQALKGETL